MKKATYPKLRITQWGDFSDPEATEVPVRFGIDIKLTPHSRWAHCADRNGPLIYRTTEAAAERMKVIRAKYQGISGAPRP